MYLIFENETDAITRADEEGKYIGYSYWKTGIGTRWVTAPVPTADGKFALDVTNYDLDVVEEITTVDTYVPLELPEE